MRENGPASGKSEVWMLRPQKSGLVRMAWVGVQRRKRKTLTDAFKSYGKRIIGAVAGGRDLAHSEKCVGDMRNGVAAAGNRGGRAAVK